MQNRFSPRHNHKLQLVGLTLNSGFANIVASQDGQVLLTSTVLQLLLQQVVRQWQ